MRLLLWGWEFAAKMKAYQLNEQSKFFVVRLTFCMWTENVKQTTIDISFLVVDKIECMHFGDFLCLRRYICCDFWIVAQIPFFINLAKAITMSTTERTYLLLLMINIFQSKYCICKYPKDLILSFVIRCIKIIFANNNKTWNRES